MKNFLVLAISFLALTSCGDDEVEADKVGVGAACATAADCKVEGQICLSQFKGGYCGVANCTTAASCPDGSACVAHTDGSNYCFRACLDKAECNANRPEGSEANCSSSIEFVNGEKDIKACVPPSN